MWLRLDDGAMDDPRVRRAGREAGWLHVWGLCYAARHLTDGFIPSQVIEELRGGTALARRLAAVGLWQQVPQGYLIPDYLESNPSGAETRKRRAKDSERKRQGFRPDSVRNPSVPSLSLSSSLSGDDKTTGEVRADGELSHTQDSADPPVPVPLTFTEQWADRILPKIGEEHQRDHWLVELSKPPEGAVVNAVEEFEIALGNGRRIKNRPAYFRQILARHRREATARAKAAGAEGSARAVVAEGRM